MVTYGIVRQTFFYDSPVYSLREPISFFLTREEQIFGILMFILALNSRYLTTVDMWLSKAFGYVELGILVISMGVHYRWLFINCIISSILFIIPQPEYCGVLNFRNLTADNFETIVEHAPKKETWVVCFFTTWAHNCSQLTPILAHLRYTRFFSFLLVVCSTSF